LIYILNKIEIRIKENYVDKIQYFIIDRITTTTEKTITSTINNGNQIFDFLFLISFILQLQIHRSYQQVLVNQIM